MKKFEVTFANERFIWKETIEARNYSFVLKRAKEIAEESSWRYLLDTYYSMPEIAENNQEEKVFIVYFENLNQDNTKPEDKFG